MKKKDLRFPQRYLQKLLFFWDVMPRSLLEVSDLSEAMFIYVIKAYKGGLLKHDI
jgi:hypothetical protein